MQFTKAHGAGNDFIIVDDRADAGHDWPTLAQQMCEPHFGVGADGLILIRDIDGPGYRMIMYNPDGSRAEMCGNGIRCLARILFERGAIAREKVPIVTDGGDRWIHIVDDSPDSFLVAVGMGIPDFDSSHVPVDLPGETIINHHFKIDGTDFDLTAVSMGNPHAVAFVDSVEAVDLPRIGHLVEHHPAFPDRVNFEICEILGPGRLRMRVWERGAGITLACGSGAAATAAAAVKSGRVPPGSLTMLVDGGELSFEWAGGTAELVMIGPAVTVYDGVWPL